ncbi:MAG: ABC transporter permease [Candidatus Binatus sp.]|uniref:ABC transporter permease n=1 Tax=Candidatus Binatus sp. TaxID=2811406 RepID=UPI002727D3FF|nr:ABC transporter permease [Candidatus Binatus sp.]MDO8431596.1 ABC transporter permease [Candidatus Binatus sp.]
MATALSKEILPPAAGIVAPAVGNREKPVITIEAGRKWAGFDLADLWQHRDLFLFLTWRDVKVRYKQTVLGAGWAILQPFLTMVLFTLIFGRLAKVPSDGIPYPIFAYAGLLPWSFFSNAVTNSGNSLVGNAALITKVYFPRMVIPGAAVGAGLVDMAIAATILIAMMAWYGIAIGPSLLMVVPLVFITAIFALAVGMWMSGLNVKYRDVRYALPFFVQIWMYATPIIYPIDFVPARWRWLLVLNPLTGMIEGYRSALFGRPFAWGHLAVSAALSVIALIYAAYSFKQMERDFADVI